MLARNLLPNLGPQQIGSKLLDSSEIFSASDFFNAERKKRFEKVREDIARRLRRVCGDLPEHEFLSLVDKIARTQMGRERL